LGQEVALAMKWSVLLVVCRSVAGLVGITITLKHEAKNPKQDRNSNTELGLFFLPCGNINEKHIAALNRRCLLL